MTTVAPYGSWTSPIDASALADGGHPVMGGRYVEDEIWWLELRPEEGGRQAVRRAAVGVPAGGDAPGPGAPTLGEARDVVGPPWNVRTRVHEYGGGAWTVLVTTTGPELIFANFADQRLYRCTPGGEPVALTPADQGMRFGDLTWAGGMLWAVRETHAAGAIVRDICTVPVDASAAEDAAAIRSVVGGTDFLAYPSPSPDGAHLAWIAWNHPNMPWDGTWLQVAEFDEAGQVVGVATALGGPLESVLQPTWRDEATMFVISDRSDWWNLYTISSLGHLTSLHPQQAETGGPLWELGRTWYAPDDDGSVVLVHTRGTDRLAVLNPDTGAQHEVPLPLTDIGLCDVRAGRALVTGAGPTTPGGLWEVDLASGDLRLLRSDYEALPEATWLPEPRARTFWMGRDVHCFVHPPTNPAFTGPEGERPPYVAFVHGGPTSSVKGTVDLTHAYFTSRGIGVIDVNYGGSTGYGRAYRERLREQWGVVDVQDTVQAVLGLAADGEADPTRLAIRGGSAGGWTVLASLTETGVFACGASYYGVAELLEFASQTHDFESRYLEGLIGPLPATQELWVTRAPVNHAADLACPVLLLQGLDDPVVPPAQSEAFRDAMVAAGIPHAYLAFPGESHGFRRAETIVAATEAELSFYGQVMGFDPVGVPRLELWRPGA